MAVSASPKVYAPTTIPTCPSKDGQFRLFDLQPSDRLQQERTAMTHAIAQKYGTTRRPPVRLSTGYSTTPRANLEGVQLGFTIGSTPRLRNERIEGLIAIAKNSPDPQVLANTLTDIYERYAKPNEADPIQSLDMALLMRLQPELAKAGLMLENSQLIQTIFHKTIQDSFSGFYIDSDQIDFIRKHSSDENPNAHLMFGKFVLASLEGNPSESTPKDSQTHDRARGPRPIHLLVYRLLYDEKSGKTKFNWYSDPKFKEIAAKLEEFKTEFAVREMPAERMFVEQVLAIGNTVAQAEFEEPM